MYTCLPRACLCVYYETNIAECRPFLGEPPLSLSHAPSAHLTLPVASIDHLFGGLFFEEKIGPSELTKFLYSRPREPPPSPPLSSALALGGFDNDFYVPLSAASGNFSFCSTTQGLPSGPQNTPLS